jgi:hypothetical protein
MMDFDSKAIEPNPSGRKTEDSSLRKPEILGISSLTNIKAGPFLILPLLLSAKKMIETKV